MRRTPGDAKQDEAEKAATVLRPATAEEISKAATTGIPGGAPGVIPEASTTIKGLAPLENRAIGIPAEGDAKVEQFVVDGRGPGPEGTWPILYNGVQVYLKPGKLMTSATYDLDYIRAQGVRLAPLG